MTRPKLSTHLNSLGVSQGHNGQKLRAMGNYVVWKFVSVVVHSEQVHHIFDVVLLTLILLTWRIWWPPNNASRWQMGFNLAFKGLI